MNSIRTAPATTPGQPPTHRPTLISRPVRCVTHSTRHDASYCRCRRGMAMRAVRPGMGQGATICSRRARQVGIDREQVSTGEAGPTAAPHLRIVPRSE